ncbi:hypothetical protein SprV_0902725200 [Sparganum proliferum]
MIFGLSVCSFCSLIFILPVSLASDNFVFVKTSEGTLRGFASVVLKKHVVAFLGVPFAEPPVKDLRFRDPVPVKPWSGVRDATKPSPTCIQPLPEEWQYENPMTRIWLNTTEMSEDCLYLNIWTNSINASRQNTAEEAERIWERDRAVSAATDNWREKLRRQNQKWRRRRSVAFQNLNGRPVMVWIHGGNLVTGSANLEIYNGAYLASEMGVIVVSIQYRLGPLGFLCLGSPGIPGNMGLMDQIAALEWVRRNIAYFGGNPSQITIFGQGSGAVSAALHILSPISSNLFQQAILQSGSALSGWAVESVESATEKAKIFARLSGCQVSEASPTYLKETETCLRSVEASSLVVNQWQLNLFPSPATSTRAHRISRIYHRRYSSKVLSTTGSFFEITFKVVVKEPFLPSWPYQIIDSQRENMNHRVLLGVNKDESIFEMINGLRMYYLKQGHIPHLPEEFRYAENIFDPLDILAFYIIDENFLHPLLLQATAFEYEIPSRAFYRKDWTAEQVQHSLAEAAGDYCVKCPVVRFADLYSQGPNTQVFMYSFEHRTSGWTWPAWTGIMQGYEAEYIFGAPLNIDFQEQFYKFNDDERQLSESMMQFWANFAATGSPSMHPGEFHTRNKKLHWNNYEARTLTTGPAFGTVIEGDISGTTYYPSSNQAQPDHSREYLILQLPKPVLARNLKRHQCVFWQEKLPMLRRRLLPNASCQLKPQKDATRETEPTKDAKLRNKSNLEDSVEYPRQTSSSQFLGYLCFLPIVSAISLSML